MTGSFREIANCIKASPTTVKNYFVRQEELKGFMIVDLRKIDRETEIQEHYKEIERRLNKYGNTVLCKHAGMIISMLKKNGYEVDATMHKDKVSENGVNRIHWIISLRGIQR